MSKVFLNQRCISITGVHFTIGAAYSGGCSPLCCVSQIWKYNTRSLFSSRYQFMSICKQNFEIFKCRLFVLLTIKQSLTKLQKQIKKILVIMSMSPPPSKPSTLEKKQVTRTILIMVIMVAIMVFFEILLKILIQTNIIFRIAFFSRHSFFSLPFLVMLQRGPAC